MVIFHSYVSFPEGNDHIYRSHIEYIIYIYYIYMCHRVLDLTSRNLLCFSITCARFHVRSFSWDDIWDDIWDDSRDIFPTFHPFHSLKFPAEPRGTAPQVLLSGHLASRVSAQSLLASRARVGIPVVPQGGAENGSFFPSMGGIWWVKTLENLGENLGKSWWKSWWKS